MVAKHSIHTLVTIGLMAALICITSPFSIPLGFTPVPITLSAFTIYLTAMVLGPVKGTLSCFLYLLLGTMGLPVFSGFMGGIHRLLGPTGGYLIGYLFMAFLSGLFASKWFPKWYPCLLGMLLGTAACYALGTVQLSLQMHISFFEALFIGVVPYIPVDILKMIFALFVGIPLKKRLLRHSIVN